jgi:hypothetical protein
MGEKRRHPKAPLVVSILALTVSVASGGVGAYSAWTANRALGVSKQSVAVAKQGLQATKPEPRVGGIWAPYSLSCRPPHEAVGLVFNVTNVGASPARIRFAWLARWEPDVQVFNDFAVLTIDGPREVRPFDTVTLEVHDSCRDIAQTLGIPLHKVYAAFDKILTGGTVELRLAFGDGNELHRLVVQQALRPVP